jgi:hypothetical protein
MIDSQATLIVIGLVVLSVLFFLLIAIVVPKAVFRFIKGPLEERIAAHYRPDEILMQDLRANSFGQESIGRLQLRGNGGLVLTNRQLHFFLFMPRSDVSIPLDAITEVKLTKSHLGKATIYDLLKVHFSSNSTEDSVAWYVTDPNAWKSRIEALKADGSTNESLRAVTGMK